MDISFAIRFKTMYKVKKPIDTRKKKNTTVKKSHYPLKYAQRQLYFRLMIEVYAYNLTFIFFRSMRNSCRFFSTLVMAVFASVRIKSEKSPYIQLNYTRITVSCMPIWVEQNPSGKWNHWVDLATEKWTQLDGLWNSGHGMFPIQDNIICNAKISRFFFYDNWLTFRRIS